MKDGSYNPKDIDHNKKCEKNMIKDNPWMLDKSARETTKQLYPKLVKTKNKRQKKTKQKKQKKQKKQIKSGGGTAKGKAKEWKDWLGSKMPSEPQFFKDITETLKLASNVLQLLQNQVTIYLYGIKDIDLILIPKEHEKYNERNDKSRIKNIIINLKKSPQFVKHLQKRDYTYDDRIDSEELWQILQEEVIAKIISDFMKRSLEYSK